MSDRERFNLEAADRVGPAHRSAHSLRIHFEKLEKLESAFCFLLLHCPRQWLEEHVFESFKWFQIC